MITTSKVGYRADIDGLRALSVLSVLFYHMGFTKFSGGFVGVDIFFVISGFLITKILYKENLSGTFSLAAFYERRIRRIFPAAVFVIIATLAAGYTLFWPADFLNLARSAMYSVAGAANLFYYWNTGYFDLDANSQPLLHYWSLAVEEQFYVVWPALIYFCTRKKAHTKARLAIIVTSVFTISLFLAIYQVPRNPMAAFYLPHLRAWELAIGAVVVFLPTHTNRRSLRNLLAVIGLTIVIYSVFNVSDQEPFPGLAALMPTVGAALLIWSGVSSETYVGRVLSLPPIRFIGLISYSLYLWHWPLIIFYRYKTGSDHPPTMHAIALIVCAITLASTTWRYVEQPFRQHRKLLVKRAAVFSTGLGVMLCVVAITSLVIMTEGFKGRLDGPTEKILAYSTYFPSSQFRIGKCFMDYNNVAAEFDVKQCMTSTGDKTILLWGDSVLAQYYMGIKDPLESAGYEVGQLTASTCPP